MTHPGEAHGSGLSGRLNWLRAGVLGTDDGIVSTAGLAHDAFAAHADVELRIDPDALINPWHAAGASALAFTIGSLLPLIAILLPPPNVRVPVTFIVVVVALAVTGAVSAKLGSASIARAVVRLVGGGAAAMAVTFGIGQLPGATIG